MYLKRSEGNTHSIWRARHAARRYLLSSLTAVVLPLRPNASIALYGVVSEMGYNRRIGHRVTLIGSPRATSYVGPPDTQSKYMGSMSYATPDSLTVVFRAPSLHDVGDTRPQ